MDSSVLEKLLESLKQAATSSDPSSDASSALSGQMPSQPTDQPDPPMYMQDAGANASNFGQPPPQTPPGMNNRIAGNILRGESAGLSSPQTHQPIDPGSVPPPVAPMPTSQQPPDMSSVLQTASQSPSTNYSDVPDLSAEKRLALAKSILAKQQSGGNAAITGLAGLGDAIARSYGHDKEANATGNVQKIEEGQNQKALEAVDTGREQKLQDFQKHVAMSKEDPTSNISHAMRGYLKGLGINVPSGMNASMMEKIMGPMGELASKQATMAELHSFHGEQIGEKQQEINAGKQKTKIEHPIGTMLFGDDENKPSSGGWKVVR